MSVHPVILLNVCPQCRSPLTEVETTETLLPLNSNHCSIGVCTICAHLVALARFSPGIVEVGTFDYDWLHKQFEEQDMKNLHDAQEGQHHKNGHWG